jgi:cell wall-associated NlpC family hydrolase
MKIALWLSALSLVVTSILVGCSPTKPSAHAQSINLVAELREQRQAKHLVQITKHLVRFADKTPYVFSGSTKFGWDCSGLVVWTYKQIGVKLPHSADKQAHLGKRVSVARPGDIVVFAYKGRTDFNHSAIYLGKGKIINANRLYGTTKIQSLKEFGSNQIRFVRIINE